MKTPDLLELATRNLRESVLRNSLTTIGIAVGVASLVSMMSLGIGLQRMVSLRLEKVGFNLLMAMPKSNFRGGGMGGPRDMGQLFPSGERTLDEAARVEISRLPGVVEGYPDIRFGGELSFGGGTYHSSVIGIPESARTDDEFNNVKGRFFAGPRAAETMIDKSVAAQLLDNRAARSQRDELDWNALARNLDGKDLEVSYSQRVASADKGGGYSVVARKVVLKIVGILDIDIQSRYAPQRGGVFVPLTFAQDLHAVSFGMPHSAGAEAYNMVVVRVKQASQVEGVENAVKRMGFSAMSIQDAMRSLRQGFAIFDMFLAVFGSLALAVASIGIVNTLVMSILERRREIGIMKAIGASDSDVKRVFFAEAGAMGVLGGVFGVTLGWLIGRLINAATNIYLTRQGLPKADVWYVSWWLVGGALCFSLIVSLIAGWYPASRASQLDPVETLRYY